MSIKKMTDLNLFNKRIFIRSDLNVPIKNQQIISDAKLRASLPTLKIALEQEGKVILASHLGRPVEGKYNEEFSLLPVVDYLQKKIYSPIRLVKNYLNGFSINKGELVVLENVRFNNGETKNDINLSKKYASFCDIFVMDAFASAHREHSSTYGIGKFVETICAGPLFIKELINLTTALKNPIKPMIAVVGGSKVSTKLKVLHSLSKITDQLIVGGGIANTFLAAKGYNIGKSLFEKKLINEAKLLLKNNNIFVPIDVRVSKEFSNNTNSSVKYINEINNDDYILDIGDESINQIINILQKANTILWNGPVGVFEFDNYRKGTEMIANTIATSKAFSIAGGGETLSVIDLFDIENKISYISTAGGAFLEFIEGKKLPAISLLEG